MTLTDSVALGQLLVSGVLFVLAGASESITERLLGQGRWKYAEWVAYAYPVCLFGAVFFGVAGLLTMYS